MDPYTPPPPIRTPKIHNRINTHEQRQLITGLMLAASGIFSLGAAIGSGGAPIFLFFATMFLSFAYCILGMINWENHVQEESAV